MIRKWMAFLLAVVMLAAAPFSAMADTQHTLSIVPGNSLGAQQAVLDLLDVTALRLTTGESSGALTVVMNDKEIVTLGMTADEDGLYAGSEVFGDDVLYITWEDLVDLYIKAIETGLQEAGGADEAVMEMIQQSADQMRDAIDTAIHAETYEIETAPVTMEESLEALEELFPDDPEMAACIKAIYEKMTVENGSFTFDKRDTADQKYRMTMDAADLVAICDTAYVRNAAMESVRAQMPDITEEEMNSALAEATAEVKKVFEASGFELIMEVYTQDNDMALVGMDMIMNMKLDGAELGDATAQSTVQLAFVYDRLTKPEGISHKAEGAAAVDQDKVDFAFELTENASGSAKGMIGLLAGGEEYVITFNSGKEAEKTTRLFELYLRSGATAILEPAASARPLVGLKIVTEPADEAKLAALESANAENSLNVMALTETQQNELLSNISANGMQAYFMLLSELPTSVMQMMMAQ